MIFLGSRRRSWPGYSSSPPRAPVVSLDLRQLRHAIALADLGSFYRAARALDVEQSSFRWPAIAARRSRGSRGKSHLIKIAEAAHATDVHMHGLMMTIAVGLASVSAPVEPRTAEAVIAADEAWLKAEVEGDSTALSSLLLPNYISVSDDGRETTGQELIARAARRGADPATAAAVASWKRSHPVRPRVRIHGDIAILTWELGSGADRRVSSSDIFVYRAGHWRAAYSQHSALVLRERPRR